MESKGEQQFQYKRYHIPNLVKAIKVFQVLSESQSGLTQLDVMKGCKFTQSAVFRILATLQDFELVDKNPKDNRYKLSKKFLELSYKAATTENLIKSVTNLMCEIRDEIRETTMLGVLLDDDFIMLHQEIGKYGFNYTGTIGLKCPMHTGAGAKAVLAFLPEEKLSKYLEKIEYTPFNNATISNKDDFLKELEKVRKNGYAVDVEEYVRGMNCVGVPVLDSNNFPTSAIWVTGPSERLRVRDFPRIAKVMMEKAHI